MQSIKTTALILLISAFATTSVSAIDIAGVKVPDTIEAAGNSLTLNGAGLRTRSIIKLYVAGLYLESASNDAEVIIASEAPMAIWLRIRSRLVSQKKMADALRDGFNNATNGNTAPIQAQIDQLMSMMSEPIKKRDRFTLAWDPAASGTRVSKNEKELGVIDGIQFKQAAFGIWLSEKPAQGSLKKAMLGN